jgi:threonine dehydrogenase-like Zn-dependent dehydrogenase
MKDQKIPNTITAVVMDAIGSHTLIEEPVEPLKDGEYFVKTLYSGISAGTELTFFLGTNPKGVEGWDQERRLFRGDMEPDNNDIFPKHEGDMEVGTVIASKNEKVKVGTNVAMRYRHRTGYVGTAEGEAPILLPEGFDPILGIWVNKMGPISMNGILYAADEVQRNVVEQIEGSLKDQKVIVFGAGMIGILCGVFAKWAGAREVIIVDGIDERLALAEKLGLVPFKAHPTMAVDIKDRWKEDDAMNSGADIALQCTGSDFLLSQAFGCLREQGTVVDLGFYQQGTNQVFLGKEFHHNRLRHICAQIGALPRHQQGAWDKSRLSHETINFLQKHGETLKEHLITHIVPFEKTQEMFERLAERDPEVLQVVLQP